MTLIWILASKQKTLFFADSTAFRIKSSFSWKMGARKSYVEWRDGILNAWARKPSKIIPISGNIVCFECQAEMRDGILALEKDEQEPLEFAEALRKFIVEDYATRTDLDINLEKLWNHVVGFNGKRKEIEVYKLEHQTNFKPMRMFTPYHWIGSMSSEPIEILEQRLFYGDFSEAITYKNGKPITDADKLFECTMKNALEDANKIFDDINKRYPLYMKPLDIGQLDKNGFRWIQNEFAEKLTGETRGRE